MEVFRLSRDTFARKLQASGKEARWNRGNQFVMYTAQSRSLSTLELVVHRNSVETAFNYELMVISISDNENLYTRISVKDLPQEWRRLNAYAALQEIGSDWYSRAKSLILQVPSVIVPNEYNYIINLSHPDFSEKTVSLVRSEKYFWDERLL